MKSNFREVSFSTHAHIKNIIGKELINDDNVAVMELVKNSYDAGATKVIIKFKNLVEDKNKQSELIIIDDGMGMSENDILTKWLNIAYSSKKENFTQNNRYQAGNKGVGRFSCDRLGKKLNLYTKQKNGIFIHLKISWKDFEDANRIDIQIQDIPVLIRELNESEFKNETGFDIFEHGTIIQITDLNEEWIEFNKKNNLFSDIEIDKTKLLRLKNSLERLINPNQSYDEQSFKIFINVIDELNEDSSTPYHEKVTGEVKNQIFEKLDFKTTFIESFISEDGSKIVTELKDKNETIFRLIEKNIDFPLLKDIKITIYYLNPYAKGFFKKQTGIDSVEFGSVYLFINGFRIPPYGDRENDAFGLEVRKGQGTARYFGNREILGRIEINDFNNNFKIISSREGIVQNSSYKQLIRDSEKQNRKYNGYFYTTLKRLEKYVVDGLKWDSIPEGMREPTIQKEIVEGKWDESNEIYKIEKKEAILNTSEIIKQMLTVNQKNILDLYINDELIENLIEDDKEKTNKKLQDFIKNFGNLSSEILDENTQKAIKKLTKNIDDESLSNSFKNILVQKKRIEEELEEEKQTKQELYKLFRKKIRDDRKKAKLKEIKLEEQLKETEEKLNQKKKHNAFQGSILGTEKKYIIGLQHQIKHSTSRILNNLQLFLEEKGVDSLNNDEKSFLKVISMESSKILSIANFITKANYNVQATEAEDDDIVNFINHYINEIYINESKIIDTNFNEIKINTNEIEYKCKYIPLEITTVIDNLISNAENANAKIISFEFIRNNCELVLKISDDGNGIKPNIINNIFDFGTTTTDGSGIGLYNVKSTIESMNGTISVESDGSSFSIFTIRINNEISV
ncbi:two-component system sensor histidine kinase [Aliarcobacter faecis]|uniref:sensor histidine kinase n=1 Tax=Aliarcobacter faecis TaxID=1564138 RepID=UPI00047C8FA4|nr:sensor histidine kinase [Aliarcobacter faecis]QKF72364.1 two-component system sensor histidine kinase [Aliarcobacter faecis]